jgi:hypothetical protein
MRRRLTEATSIEGDQRRAFPQFNPGFVGLAGRAGHRVEESRSTLRLLRPFGSAGSRDGLRCHEAPFGMLLDEGTSPSRRAVVDSERIASRLARLRARLAPITARPTTPMLARPVWVCSLLRSSVSAGWDGLVLAGPRMRSDLVGGHGRLPSSLGWLGQVSQVAMSAKSSPTRKRSRTARSGCSASGYQPARGPLRRNTGSQVAAGADDWPGSPALWRSRGCGSGNTAASSPSPTARPSMVPTPQGQ